MGAPSRPATPELVVASTAEWRAWLDRNCRSSEPEQEVWLVIHHKASGVASVAYHEAIEQALCFGWIDSHARKRDAGSFRLRFTPRSERSTWSAVNRERAARMIEQGLMTPHGQALIDRARASGTWQLTPDDGSLPGDLQERLEADPAAAENFARFPPSSKRLILEWIAKAKRPDTRQRRIAQTVDQAAHNIRANHPTTRPRR